MVQIESYGAGLTNRSTLSPRCRPWRLHLLTLFVPAVTTSAAVAFQPSPVVVWSLRTHLPAVSRNWDSSPPRVSWSAVVEGGVRRLGALPRRNQQRERQQQRCRLDQAPAPSVLLTATMDAGIMAQEEGDRTTSGWGGSPSIESPSPMAGEETLLSPVLIKVIGVGGGGGNAVDGMITTATRKLAGVEFVAMNTDTQALTKSRAETKITLGSGVTRGLGAGGKPEVGRAAAKESLPEIEKVLAGADMVFVTAGMGGGTGTGAAPVIAQAARDMGCLTVAVVTEPFEFEGRQRSRQAAGGVAELRKCADTVLVVDNNRLLEIVPGRMTMSDAFLVADDVLRQGVIGTSEIIVRPGLINVDFADVREVVKNSGTALIGIGTGTGKTRAEDAAVGAICSPLLDFPINEAAGVIFNIVGGLDMSLTEVNAAARIVQANVHPDANIIVGALVDERCGKQVSVTVLATGFGGEPFAVNGEDASVGQYPAEVEARPNPGERERGGVENSESRGGYPSVPVSRPCFDGRANSNEASPKKAKMGGVFRRLFGRRD